MSKIDSKLIKENKICKKLLCVALVMVMAFSALLPGNVSPLVTSVEAKNKIIVGTTNKSMIASSEKNVTYTYRSSNTKVATVSGNGIVTGKKKGKVSIIRYKTVNNKTTIDKVKEFTVAKLKVKGKSSVYVNGSYTYSTNATKTVTWKTNKSSVAKVNSNGVLKAKKAGTVVLTAKLGKTKVKKSITVKKDVIDHLESVYAGTSGSTGLVVYAIYKSGVKKQIKNYKTSTVKNSNGTVTLKITYDGKTLSVNDTDGTLTSKSTTTKSSSVTTADSSATNTTGNTTGSSTNNTTGTTSDTSTTKNTDNSSNVSGDSSANSSDDSSKSGTSSDNITSASSNAISTASAESDKKEFDIRDSNTSPDKVDGAKVEYVEADYSGDKVTTDSSIDKNLIRVVLTLEDGSQKQIEASTYRLGNVVTKNGKMYIETYYTVDGTEYLAYALIDTITPVSLQVTTDRECYYTKETLKKEDFLVEVVDSDGNKYATEDWACNFTSTTKAGDVNIRFNSTVLGKAVTGDYTLTVKVPEVVGLVNLGGNLTVKEGKDLDLSLVNVGLKYEDGSVENVSGISTDYDKNDKTLGERIVTVTYGDYDLEIKINVLEKEIISISATSPSVPTLQGEELDISGVTVKAKYEDNSEEAVTGWTTDYSKEMTAGNHTLVVSYGGVTCNMLINIEDKLNASAYNASTMVGHTTTLTMNKSGLTYVVKNGTATVTVEDNIVKIVPVSSGKIVVTIKRELTGEACDITLNAAVFTCTWTNINGGTSIALGDRIKITTNSPSLISYVLTADDNTVYKGSSTNSATSYTFKPEKTGVIEIIAKDSESGVTVTKQAIVRAALAIKGSDSVSVGDTITLKTTKSNVSWSSSNNAIAKINDAGVVSGIKAGTVTITATFPDYGNRTVSKTITVTK